MVSPSTGAVRVKRGNDQIRVDLEGGWRKGLVYRVLLLPGVRDLFGNEMKEPAELVFSTGPAIAGAVLAGVVTDRITGRPAARAFIEATLRADSLTWVTTVDSSSFYAFRYLTPGLYELVAYTDQNRNGRRDASESASLTQQRAVNRDGDTVVVELSVVPADTTPPRLNRGEVRDSLQVRLFTDDYLDPDASIGLVQVRIRSLPDSVELPGPHALMTVDSFNALPKPEPDTMAGDSAARRPPAVPALAAPPPGRQMPGMAGGRPAVNEFGEPTGPLPYQEFVLVPASPLRAGGRYLIEVLGLTNVSARSNGGGEVEIELPEPKPTPPDTGTARPRSRTIGS